MRAGQARETTTVWASEANGTGRVAIFLDVPSLLRMARENGVEFDPAALLEALERIGPAVMARSYSAVQPGRPFIAAHSCAADLAFAAAEAGPRRDGWDGADGKVDSFLMADLLSAGYEDEADTFVIGSADPDYLPAVNLLKRLGKRVVVLAYPFRGFGRLAVMADEVVLIPPCAEALLTHWREDGRGPDASPLRAVAEISA